jgi:protein-disulfide isomerase
MSVLRQRVTAKTLIVVLAMAILGVGIVLAIAPVPSQAETQKFSTDRILGNADAKVEIIEYASLTCSHCAQFHAGALPQLKERYIDTGKAKLIFRNFPLDGLSLKAAALAQCMPEQSYFAFLNILFTNQAQWANAAEPEKVLTQYAKLGGLSEANATACMNDTKIMDDLSNVRLDAEKAFGVNGTPTFIVGGKKQFTGARAIEEFAKIIDPLLGDAVSANEAPKTDTTK